MKLYVTFFIIFLCVTVQSIAQTGPTILKRNSLQFSNGAVIDDLIRDDLGLDELPELYDDNELDYQQYFDYLSSLGKGSDNIFGTMNFVGSGIDLYSGPCIDLSPQLGCGKDFNIYANSFDAGIASLGTGVIANIESYGADNSFWEKDGDSISYQSGADISLNLFTELQLATEQGDKTIFIWNIS